MKPSVVSHALRALVVGEKQAVFIWGSPGSGKSAVVKQLAAELGIALHDIRALLLDPVDLRGLPFVGKDGRSQWATPDFLPQDGEGILFLDELNAAPWSRTFRELPNIDAILLNPTQEPVPENAAAQYAVASALARCASDTNFDRICLYLNRLPTEFRVLCVRDATLRQPAIRCTAGYVRWAVENHNAIA